MVRSRSSILVPGCRFRTTLGTYEYGTHRYTIDWLILPTYYGGPIGYRNNKYGTYRIVPVQPNVRTRTSQRGKEYRTAIPFYLKERGEARAEPFRTRAASSIPVARFIVSNTIIYNPVDDVDRFTVRLRRLRVRVRVYQPVSRIWVFLYLCVVVLCHRHGLVE